MKRTLSFLLAALPLSVWAQGWPANYEGVMLQGFYWDSFTDTQWTNLERQADEMSQYFSLIWVPQSGKSQNNPSMGYDVLYYWNQNSSFGTEQELRSMINAFKQRGTGIVADVVVNHRGNVSSWVDFPAETYQGVTYEMVSTDICADDDGGATAKNNPGVSLAPNNDEGEGWGGMRDLDHKSENVQRSVKAYTRYLLDDLGYTGFRYDMVKGFNGSHVADYNRNAGVTYSVGECFDGNVSTLKNWINSTKVDGVPQSAAFDFAFRYTCRDAGNKSSWTSLKNSTLAADETYRRYAITFVENHDTERRENANQDPIVKDTLALNAWMLSMPGTPCVFLKHWQQCKREIKNMIEMRRLMGIHNQSTYSDFASNANYCVRKVNGTKGTLGIAVGDYTGAMGSAYMEVLSGKRYRYFLPKSLNVAWISTPSGIYAEGKALKVTLSAVTADVEAARIVYTTDGSLPTASHGTQVASGTEIEITQAATLRAALLVAGTIGEVQSRTYTFAQVEEEPETPAFEAPACCKMEEGEVCAFFEAPASWTKTIKVWMWDNGGTKLNYTGGTWPGAEAVKVGQTESGVNVWKWSYTKTFNVTTPMIIFSNSGSPQTADLDFVQGGYYREKGLVGVIAPASSIQEVHFDGAEDGVTYDNLGRRVSGTQSGRLYIRNGQKFILR